MPRESSIAESAKQRSLRVPLDHYEQCDQIARLKLLLSAIALGAAACYIGWLTIGGQAASKQLSPGLLANVHATWNDDCQVCHQSFRPLRGDAVDFMSLVKAKAEDRALFDQACLKCHDAPAHHTSAKPSEVPTCATCHHEHQGASADITRAADSMCLACHRDLQHHRHGPSGLTRVVKNVTGFGPPADGRQQPHPDFHSLDEPDPGNIKFNHWLHLQPGIATRDSKSKLRLDQLDESQRPRYEAYANTNGFVQLDCSACHQPQSDGGKYMQPISFEQHCRTCHPLQFTLPERQRPLDVPHGLSAERLRTILDGLIFSAEKAERDRPEAAADESGDLPLVPGKTLGSNLAQKIGQDGLSRRTTAARAVAAKCSQCHFERDAAGPDTDLPELMPANIPSVWLRHARFDHSAHRHVEQQCKACHAEAYAFEQQDKPQFLAPPPGAEQARDDHQVMITGLANCATCHAPQRGNRGGARHDCAECHAYHGRDPHMQPVAMTNLFPRSPLEKHVPGHPLLGSSPASASVANPIRDFTFTSLTLPTPNLIGPATCASSGCHGDSRTGTPAWKSAFSSWLSRDPHAQAFNVLWTFRSREMTRLLDRPRAASVSASSRSRELLSGAEHFQFIQDRCIGCHATPSPEMADVTA
jgi:hypothetical protein